MPRRFTALSLALALFSLGPSVGAQIRQPDGMQVPDLGASMPSLQDYLNRRGEGAAGLNVVRDAAIMPERFLPGCTIRFTVVGRDSGYANAFGWYNVTAGRGPMASELNELVPSAAPEGFTATANFQSDTRYRGGEIGFYLRTPEPYTFYSERAYQPDRVVSGGFIHLLIYDSRVTPNAFYFAWEDLFNGGDNDFQDLLMIVDNLVCAGGGDACDTGERGVCAAGIRQCRSGVLTCVRAVAPTAERCDGIDNDCNGMTDEGMNLCPVGRVCDQGVCVERCLNELGCLAGLVCTDRGTCVEAACATVTCPAGSICRMGMCREPCAGVTCPRGLVCRVGRCVDPCSGVMCDGGQVCVNGVCTTRCPCRRCGAGESCFSDGRCRPTVCSAVTCGAGQYCEGGACRDACAGAVCPFGETCSLGGCVPAGGVPDAGVRDGGVTMPDAGAPAPDGGRDAGSASDVLSPPRDAPPVMRDAGAPDTGEIFIEEKTGCACGAGTRTTRNQWGFCLLALGVLARRRRR